MDQSSNTQIAEAVLSRWRRLAERATPVVQICSVLIEDEVISAMVAQGGRVIAYGMTMSDAVFHAEARKAVEQLANELDLHRRYADYVREAIGLVERMIDGVHQSLLPVSFDQWLENQQKGYEE